MAKKGHSNTLITLVTWITGVLVSISVGYGMINGVLGLPAWLGGTIGIPMIVGWIVVITTIVSAVLAVLQR